MILVKLADRLHNMRTIKSMRPDKQVQKARETMDIYAPLAGRMGMQWMRDELEDLSFRVLNPEGRNSILRRFITLQRETGDVVQKITGDIRKELEKAGIEADVYGRAKKPYSIWRKMQEKDQGFSRLSDIYGFRVITAIRGRLLFRPGGDPSTLAGGAGPVQGLYQPTEIKRLPIDPYLGFGARWKACGGSDPDPANARGRRGGRCRPLGLSGWPAGEKPFCSRSCRMDCRADRAVRKCRRPRRVPRTRQDGDVFGPGLLFHAERARW